MTLDITEGLFRQYLRFQMAYENEIREPHFTEFLWIFDHQIVRKEWWCRRCIGRRERQCTKGRQQGFQCLAYWRWHHYSRVEDTDTEAQWMAEVARLQTIPLTHALLQDLDHMQLFGVFYLQQRNLATMDSFAKVSLRTRLIQGG